jgi:hypothetical protein
MRLASAHFVCTTQNILPVKYHEKYIYAKDEHPSNSYSSTKPQSRAMRRAPRIGYPAISQQARREIILSKPVRYSDDAASLPSNHTRFVLNNLAEDSACRIIESDRCVEVLKRFVMI